MDAFYQTVAAFCFTLLGLWWAVVQFRHAEWMNNLRQRRAAYSVHLSFLVPGIMSLGAMIAGDVKILWRLVFIVACGFGILAMIFLSSAPRRTTRNPTEASSSARDAGGRCVKPLAGRRLSSSARGAG